MTAIRRHLRAWATVWLLCQLVGVALFAAEPSCCLAHQGAHASHGAVPAESCPMRGVTGDACPMHRSPAGTPDDPFHSGDALAAGPFAHAAHAAPPAPPADPAPPAQEDCVMRAVCNGPAASLASLFPLPAVLADAPRTLADPAHAPLAIAREELKKLRVSPDTPPPRA